MSRRAPLRQPSGRRHSRRYFTPTAAVLRRVGFYGAWLLTLLVVQSTLSFSPRMAGALPALVLVAVAALGFFDSERVGAIAGVVAGWALDSWSGTRLFLLPLVGFAVGYFCGFVAERHLPRGIIPFGVCLGGVAILQMPLNIVYYAINYNGIRVLTLIVHVLLPATGRTLLWGVPVALATRLIVRLVRKTEQLKGATDDRLS